MKLTLGMRLGQLAADLDIPQNLIAKELGVGASVVSQWGSGTVSLNLRNATGFARLVNRRLIAVDAGQVVAEGEDLANLRMLRLAADLSRQEVGRKLGISPDSVYQAERRAGPTMHVATCQRHLLACSYRVGLATAVELAVAA